MPFAAGAEDQDGPLKTETAARGLARSIWQHRRVLAASTRFELAKRYSGSAFGLAWVVLYPTLLLTIYLFVYRAVLRMRFPGQSEMDYVLYVFSGLIPYMGFMEAVASGCVSLRQNMHLVKNVMLPIELIPVRAVFVGLSTEFMGLLILIALAAANLRLSWRIACLPPILCLQALLLIGIVLVLASLAVALPDVSYFVNLAMLLLMFVSPIGFRPEMVPGRLAMTIHANPVHYLIEAFRFSVLSDHAASPRALVLYLLLCLATFFLGAAFFRRFKSFLVDYE